MEHIVMTLDEFFDGYPRSRQLFDRVHEMADGLELVEIKVTKSQAALTAGKAFVRAWIPPKVLRGRGALLVLTFVFNEKDPSPRWKEIVEPRPGRFTHHLEINDPADIDEQVRGWLAKALRESGRV